MREFINIIDDTNAIDILEESARDLWNSLTDQQRVLVESRADVARVKSIIEHQQSSVNINVTTADIGKSFCAMTFYFMPTLPRIELKNTGDAILYRIEGSTYFFKNGSKNFKFPDDQVGDSMCYYRIVCSNADEAGAVETMIQLSLPNEWEIKKV
jgi:hypothetical protein